MHLLKKLLFILTLCCSSSSLWAAANNPKVIVETSIGQLIIELLPHDAPTTVKNFLEYVDNEFYNGTIIHRAVPGFFIQGGGFTSDFTLKKIRAPIKNESSNGLKNNYAMISMAHINNPMSDAITNDAEYKAAATSQFIINLQDNPSLNNDGRQEGYAVFGKVIEGIEIAKKIALEPRGMHEQYPEAPNEPIQIIKIERINTKKMNNTILLPSTAIENSPEAPASSPQ